MSTKEKFCGKTALRSNDCTTATPMWTRKSRGCLYYCTTARSPPRDPPFCYFVVTSRERRAVRFSEVRKRSRSERFITTTPSCSQREYRGSQARDPAINPTEKRKVLSSLPRRERSRQLSSSYNRPLYSPPLLALLSSRARLKTVRQLDRRVTGRGSRSSWIIKVRFPRPMVLGYRRLINYLLVSMMQLPPAGTRWLYRRSLLAHPPTARAPDEAALRTCTSLLQGDYPNACTGTLFCGVPLKIVSVLSRSTRFGIFGVSEKFIASQCRGHVKQ